MAMPPWKSGFFIFLSKWWFFINLLGQVIPFAKKIVGALG
jgi:hypothetical protein